MRHKMTVGAERDGLKTHNRKGKTMGSKIIVFNIKGTEENPCGCGSWLRHWRRFSARALPEKCPVDGCENPPEVGAHVQLHRIEPDDRWCIIPLCHAHNVAAAIPLLVAGDIEPVSANVEETCGKIAKLWPD